MRDLTHYFVSPTKSCEMAASQSEVINEPNEIIEDTPSRKRSRVKIKISLKDTKARVCDIIESKNDLIDKTPSPFTGGKGAVGAVPRDDVTATNAPVTGDDTPKRACEAATERAESDAFKVLMTRKKAIRYSPLPILSLQEAELTATMAEETKSKLKQTKDKLVVLADKKGYSKRKLEELEEGERIEKRLERRAKVFKLDAKDTQVNDGTDSLCNPKQAPRGLLNYFSKATPEQKQKSLVTMSTIVVRADVHVSDDSAKPAAPKPKTNLQKNTSYFDGDKKEKARSVLSLMDDIQLIRSESLSPPPIPKPQQLTSKRTKPKWSMQIKLNSHSDDDTIPELTEVSDDDYVFTPKSKAKLKKEKKKHKSPKSDKERKHKEREHDTMGEITLVSPRKQRKLEYKQDEIPNANDVDFKPNNASPVNDANSVDSQNANGKLRHGKGGKTKKPNKDLDSKSEVRFEGKVEVENKRTTRSSLSASTELTKNATVGDDLDETNNSDYDSVTLLSDDNLAEDENYLFETQNKENALLSSDCEIVDVQPITPKITSQEKLAPLFLKKSKPDPFILEARRSFLKSGVPENMKKFMGRKPSSNDLGTSTLPFPTVSHISQLDIETRSGESDLRGNDIPMRTHNTQKLLKPYFDVTQFRFVTGLKEANTAVSNQTKMAPEVQKADIEAVLTELEEGCSDVRTIWQSIAPTVNAETRKPFLKKRGRKRKSRGKDIIQEESLETEVINPAWTCKYKPTTAAETVGNEYAVTQLRNWLSGWRLPSSKDVDSSDEFYSSDCSFSSSNDNNQVAVLLGPHGSGKTASVYAVAEELGYRVLEVNASSRRTGKKILLDFQEATKSHRVKKDPDQASLVPMLKQGARKKVPQNSLILIEDVDLIFDEDEGFISAAFQLAANTKRPIVMTCKEKCSHLSKMAPQQLLIHFQAATGARVSALLELISLAESGFRLPQSYLEILLRGGDLRQALLQLQYLLLSGPPTTARLPVIPRSTLWQDLQHLVYKPASKASKKHGKEYPDEKTTEAKQQTIHLLNSLSEKLDNVSLIATMVEVEDPTPPRWAPKLNPSLSLDEDTKPYSSTEILMEEIADWLRQATLYSKGNKDSKVSQTDYGTRLAVRRQIKLGIDQALSYAIPWTLEHRSTSTDYLPVLRTICRSEQDRLAVNNKRGNRFHHYLHGLDLPSASTKPNILEAAGKIMQEKVEKR